MVVSSATSLLKRSGKSSPHTIFSPKYHPLFISAPVWFIHTTLSTKLLFTITLCSSEPLTVQAPGTQTRSFCYVSDMVSKSLFGFGFSFMCRFKHLDQLSAFNVLIFNWWIKVDGLIRLMGGDNTGPINIGNPGFSFAYSSISVSFFTRPTLIPFSFCDSGEFTMLELAETVKEVNS